MEESPKKGNRWLVVAGIGFATTIILLVIFGIAFGGSYRRTLSNFVEEPKISELTTTEVKKIKKVTFQKRNTSGCIEVTPDGIVRVYSVCGEELESADRLDEKKNINKLFQLLREKDFKSQKLSADDEVYEITVETETGTEIFYVVVGGGGNEEELLETLDDILEDIPIPSATPIQGQPSFSPFAPSNSPQTSNGQIIYPSPSASPSGYVETFTCEFSETRTKKKPVNVSNIICTSDPSPAP